MSEIYLPCCEENKKYVHQIFDGMYVIRLETQRSIGDNLK